MLTKLAIGLSTYTQHSAGSAVVQSVTEQRLEYIGKNNILHRAIALRDRSRISKKCAIEGENTTAILRSSGLR